MPKKQRNRLRGVPAPVKKPKMPYLFDLPADTRSVHLAAFISGMEGAFQEKKKRLHLSPEAIEAEAIEAALIWEKAQAYGKMGTNEPVLFRKMFVSFFMRIHPVMAAFLETKPSAFTVLKALTDEKRGSWLEAFAEQNLDQVELTPLDAPLHFEW